MNVGGLALWILVALSCGALAGCGDDDSSGGGDGGTDTDADTDTDTDSDADGDAGADDFGAELSWVKRSGGDSDEWVNNFAVLPDDSLVMVSSYLPSNTIFGEGEENETALTGGGEPCPSATPSQGALAKYVPDGSLVWAKALGVSPGFGIATLPGGDFALVGAFCGTQVWGEGEATEVELTDEAGAIDMYVAAYEADGSLVWAKSIVSDVDDFLMDMAGAPDGSVFLLGSISGSMVFGPGETTETELVGDGGPFLAKYSADGGFAWARLLAANPTEYPRAISIAPDGTLWIAGAFDGSITLGAGEAEETVLTSAGGTDLYVARLDADGALACAVRAGGTDGEGASYVAAANDGSAIATGGFSGPVSFGEGEGNETALTPVGGADTFLAKFGADCALAWALAVGSPDYDGPLTLAVADDGASVLTGQFASASVDVWDAATGHAELTSASGIGEFVVRYDADGALQWAAEIEKEVGYEPDYTYAAFLSDGSTYLGGAFSGIVTIGAGDPGETTLDSSTPYGGARDRWLARVAP